MTTAHLAALMKDCDNASERLRRYIAEAAKVHPNELPNAPATLVGLLVGDDLTDYFRTESARCAHIREPLALIALRPRERPLSQHEERALFNALSDLITQPGDAIGRSKDGAYLVFRPWETATQGMAETFAAQATTMLPEHDWNIGHTTISLAHLQIPTVECTPAPTRLRNSPAPPRHQQRPQPQGRS